MLADVEVNVDACRLLQVVASQVVNVITAPCSHHKKVPSSNFGVSPKVAQMVQRLGPKQSFSQEARSVYWEEVWLRIQKEP